MPTQINNTATATYRYGESGSATATSNVASTSLLSQYQLETTKTALVQNYRPGDNIPFIVQVKNTGTSPLYAVTMTDDLAGGNLIYVGNSVNLLRNETISSLTPTTTNPLVVEIVDELPAGEEVSVIYTARVSANLSSEVEQITNSATFSAQGTRGGALIPDTPTSEASITPEDYASIEMTKSVSADQVTAGVPFDYVITLENAGNADATGIVITDVLPTDFTINSITAVSGETTTTFETSDYSVDSSTNTLTLPSTSSSKTISVPARGEGGVNTTTITINGQIG